MQGRFYAAVIAALLLGSSSTVVGQDDAPEPETPEAGQEAAERPAPPVSDDIFIPSEEVQADEELVFPVNI